MLKINEDCEIRDVLRTGPPHADHPIPALAPSSFPFFFSFKKLMEYRCELALVYITAHVKHVASE